MTTMIGKLVPYLFLLVDNSSSIESDHYTYIINPIDKLLERWKSMEALVSIASLGCTARADNKGPYWKYKTTLNPSRTLGRYEWSLDAGSSPIALALAQCISEAKAHCTLHPIAAVEFVIVTDGYDTYHGKGMSGCNKAVHSIIDLGWKFIALIPNHSQDNILNNMGIDRAHRLIATEQQ